MTLKLWDLNMDAGPVQTYSVHESLRGKVRAAPVGCCRAAGGATEATRAPAWCAGGRRARRCSGGAPPGCNHADCNHARWPLPKPLQLCDLYESDCIFDKFDAAMSGDGRYFATGTYSNFFRCALGAVQAAAAAATADVWVAAAGCGPQRKHQAQRDADGGKTLFGKAAEQQQMRAAAQLQPVFSRRQHPQLSTSSHVLAHLPCLPRLPACRVTGTDGSSDNLLEASRDPTRKRLASSGKLPSRFGLSRGGSGRGSRSGSFSVGEEALAADFSSKLLHLSWHPHANVIATAASNSLYLFYGSGGR